MTYFAKSRVEAFSDGVFAIIVTLLVLEIKVPHLAHDASAAELATALYTLLPKLLSWVISFLMVCVIWVNHHRILDQIVHITHGIFWFNALLLLCYSFIPFPTALLVAAVPQANQSIAEALGDVSQKVIIDVMNYLRAKPEPFSDTTEALRHWTNCPAVVKCFNTTGAENMKKPVYGNVPIDMFVAGSSTTGKATARQLALDAGFAECYNFGGDDKVPLLEQFAFAWINLAIMQGHGRGMAFKVLKR